MCTGTRCFAHCPVTAISPVQKRVAIKLCAPSVGFRVERAHCGASLSTVCPCCTGCWPTSICGHGTAPRSLDTELFLLCLLRSCTGVWFRSPVTLSIYSFQSWKPHVCESWDILKTNYNLENTSSPPLVGIEPWVSHSAPPASISSPSQPPRVSVKFKQDGLYQVLMQHLEHNRDSTLPPSLFPRAAGDLL